MPGGIVHETGVAARCVRLRSTLQAYLDECRRCGLEAEAYASLKVALAARSPLSEVDPAPLERLEAFAASLAHDPEAQDGSSGKPSPPP